MIEQQARVLRVDQLATVVRIGAQSGCAVCDSGKGCGAGLFGRMLKRSPLELEFPNNSNLSPGQAVTLGIPESLFIKLVARLYGLPLIAGLLGAIIAQEWAVASGLSGGRADIVAICGSLIAAVTALKIRARASKPDISSNDIQLKISKRELSACDVGIPKRQIIEKEV